MRMFRRAAISAGQQTGIVFDRFNRADGDIGTADSGETWTGQSPIGWIVTSGKAKRATATNTIFDSFASLALPESIGDYTVEADMTIPIYPEAALLYGRGQSGSAYAIAVRVYYDKIYLVELGSDTRIASTLANYAHSLSPGDQCNIRLKLSGTNATIYLNRVQIISNAVSAWAGATRVSVGMIESYSSGTPTVLFDNFKVTHNT